MIVILLISCWIIAAIILNQDNGNNERIYYKILFV